MASGTQDLELFVRDALLRGQTKDAIRKALLDAGWTAEQASTALGAYADVSFAVPVPRPRAQLSAREAFLYLLLFTTLYLSCYHLGSLVFDLINRAYPDPTERSMREYLAESMRWSIASLVIAFPVFIFLANYIGKDVARSPIRRLSPIRRWLTYLTLFLAAGAAIGDLTTLVYSVLAGELTVRVTLKVLVVLVIAGAVFGYYLSDLRREERE
jgi:Domain of unknown function (DUF5671)